VKENKGQRKRGKAGERELQREREQQKEREQQRDGETDRQIDRYKP
jgi:hypothetical protein